MKGKIILFISSLALLVSLSFFAYAALKEETITDELVYEVGNYKVTITGGFREGYVIPGVNLVETPFVVTNDGNVDVELRIKISFELNNQPFNDFALAPSDTVNTSANDFNSNNEFTLNGDYYYLNNELQEGQTINILTILVLDGYKVQSQESGQNFRSLITVHAKQKDHVEWTDLGSKFIS